ncbi:receptor-type tyrosine-protein phosphatase N2 isoform X2 [Teleopsis dalmanni]|nr:receptor-type tyrosine-protein phosphatase N2 isoform X2 [Teleopsis dalmanni]
MASNVQQQQLQQCIKKQQHQHNYHHQYQPHRLQHLQNQQQHQIQQQQPQLQHKQQHNGVLLLIQGWFSTHSSSYKLLHFGVVATLLQLLLVLLTLGHAVHAEGNVGCHFVRTLCLEGSEVCFDDNIFGKCIPTTGVDLEDIEKTPLTEEHSRALATMLEELQGAGLGWDHPYVQCRIQGTLFSLQKQTQLPPNLCANLAPTPTDIDPAGSLAFVRFTPPDEDYADALYYPPLKKQINNNGINTIFHQLQLQDRQSRHDPSELAHFGKLDSYGSQIDAEHVMEAFLDNERARIQREQIQREAEMEAERKLAMRNRLELYQMLAASEPDPEPYQRNAQPTLDKLEQVVEHDPSPPVYIPDDLNDSNELYFPDNYETYKRTGGNGRKQLPETIAAPRSFFRELASEQGLVQEPANREYYSHAQVDEPLDAVLMPTYKRMPTFEDSAENDFEQQALEESLIRNSLTPFEEEAMLASNSFPYKHKTPKLGRVFTEGGLLYMPQRQQFLEDTDSEEEDNEIKKEKARELLANMLGFTRRERLDVKKPGPLSGPPSSEDNRDDKGKLNKTTTNKLESKEVLPVHIKESEQVNKKKKVMLKDHSDEDHAPHTVDTEYAHVVVNNPIDSWSDGVRIMNELANILHMQGYFAYLTVQPRQVSFRVDSNNPDHKTASDIARIINDNRGVKNNILRRIGVAVKSAGVGDKTRSIEDGGVSSSRIELAEQGPDVTHIMVYMLAGAGAAAVIVIFVTLILIKRHDKKRDKLGGLQSGIAGAESCSKDYQDLCRARMAGKGNAAEPVAGGRITSLSKENDRPPSSRSSTSSWSEEPALTNMDISTGHMVLSYMEDHLRNKGRLQREWEALCRYEAEPSARDAGQQSECANLNRPGAPLPYDHSRVVLNHLANAEGLDYINASTITDHDPRAPAYVAAQGPLPTTLAHFWQMIWEQGAVVIVALCRLQENGEIACARYWPEEGAEVYHIYEVHLVSEHIWCDDYLVRSFYLKNLRTSETRTVTQFHFLSWPQSGVPPQAKALLDFRRKVNKSYRGRSCPIVVHSSTGAGRTGAYILLDLVLGRMNKGAREIDIAATLEHLRDQRAGLVATRQQFEFVLMAVAEEVHAILKALPANQSNEKREVETKDAIGATGVLKEAEEADSDNEDKNVTKESDVKTAPTSAAVKEKGKAKDTENETKTTHGKIATTTAVDATNVKK